MLITCCCASLVERTIKKDILITAGKRRGRRNNQPDKKKRLSWRRQWDARQSILDGFRRGSVRVIVRRERFWLRRERVEFDAAINPKEKKKVVLTETSRCAASDCQGASFRRKAEDGNGNNQLKTWVCCWQMGERWRDRKATKHPAT